MHVSVIIPAWNEAAAVGLCVRRALAAGAFEAIVVDGDSDDATRSVAQDAGAAVIGSPRGRAVQQLAGARQARGDILFFLHADCWPDAGAVEQIHLAIENRGAVAGCFEQKIEAQGLAYRWLERGNAWRAARRGLPYGDQGLWFTKELFWKAGGFPEVRLMEDVLLMRRVRKIARPVVLPGPLHVSARRWQRRGVVRQTLRNWMLLTALRLGASPDRLADYYGGK